MERPGKHVATGKLAPSGERADDPAEGRQAPSSSTVPFAETKEQFGGYHLLECRDLDEALALAERIPTLPHGGVVEVRAGGAGRLNEVIEAVYREEVRGPACSRR